MSRDIIAAIDGALDDWAVSADAMRWTPDPVTPRPTTPSTRAYGGLWQFQQRFVAYERVATAMTRPLTEQQLRALEDLREMLRPRMRRVNEVLREVMRAIEPTRFEIPPTPEDPDEDVRARALRLRQTRNTGPAKPAPGPTRDRRR